MKYIVEKRLTINCDKEVKCVCYCTCKDKTKCTCVTTCGCDGRTQVSNVNIAPYNKIALLLIEWSEDVTTQAMGFLINSKHMLTNAHCVYNPEYGTVKSITAYFGAKGYTYSSSISASDWSYCSSYPSDDSASNDWAHIELGSSPGRGYFSLSASVTSSTTLTLCGYLGDRAIYDMDATINNRLWYMYKMSGVAEGVYSKCLYYYKIDTNRGQSGSPIYNSANQVVGIDSKSGKKHNSGCRITQSMINAFYINGWCA